MRRSGSPTTTSPRGRCARKPDASIVQAARAVADGRADALVSAGSTGAALAASLLHVKRLPGVYRPAVAVPLPAPGRPVLLLDVGANVEVRPEHLVQFAYMGAAFSERVLGVDAAAGRPAVGGRGAGQGHARRGRGPRAARRAASSNSSATSRATTSARGEVDVVVTDGFTGNVALKPMEGTARSWSARSARRPARAPLSKLGGLLLRPSSRELREQLDPESGRRRLPARPARPGGDLPRQLQPARDRERDRARRARRRGGGRGEDRGGARAAGVLGANNRRSQGPIGARSSVAADSVDPAHDRHP